MTSRININSSSSIIIKRTIIDDTTRIIVAGEVETITRVVVDMGIIYDKVASTIKQESISTIVINLRIVEGNKTFRIIIQTIMICVYSIFIIKYL